MSEVEELRRLMHEEHASVLRSLGRLEATSVIFQSSIIEAKEARDKFQDALDRVEAKVDVHVARLDQYRNWMIGFGAGATLIFSFVWWLIASIGAEILKVLK